MKTDRILEEIKSRIDIVEFISEYVHLKKSGQNYRGLCPFHTEKFPSFTVSQVKQIFHCFGCGAGGDVISFLMKHDNLSFNEALIYLAKKAGLSIDSTSFRGNYISSKRGSLLQLNEEALNFFINSLRNSDIAKAYLKNRGITEQSISEFSIGYAPGGQDSLFRYLKKSGHSESLIKDAGLISAHEKGFRDLFRKRIIFPIYSIRNDLIAFGGRVMDDSLPKYINSPETEIFKKSETLFGINLSKDEIRKRGYAIIVEGYLDTIVCHQYGFRNTVAPLGTALTSKHLQKLKLFTKNAVLVFDADDAGIAAARRSLTIICEYDFKSKILLLPKGDDPDSFLRKRGRQNFENMLANSKSTVDFLLGTSKKDKRERVREVLGVIADIKDIILADELLGELADRSKIHETVLRSELENLKRKPRFQKVEDLKPVAIKHKKEEALLLGAIISFPEKAGEVLSKLSIDDIENDIIRSLFKKISSLSKPFSLDALLDATSDPERRLVTELSVNPDFDPEHVDKNISDCLRILKIRRFEEKKKEAEKLGDIKLLDALLKERRRLIKGEKP